MQLLPMYVDDIVKRALVEDINYLDTTADLLPFADENTTAYWISKDDGVLCGCEVAARAFTLLDSTVRTEFFKKDGDKINKGDIIAEFSGKTHVLLKGERTALNLIQHMSGIATMTSKAVELCRGTRAAVTDTRKTLPGLRALQKYAVVCGGGRNHRFNLSDGAMLKDNHIDACGGITNTVNMLREKLGHMVKIEVETRTLDEVKQALDVGADVIMLDNMSYDQMKEAVSLNNGRAKLEASGNITLENIRKTAECGVDIISLGALTHSVKAFDISMKIKK